MVLVLLVVFGFVTPATRLSLYAVMFVVILLFLASPAWLCETL